METLLQMYSSRDFVCQGEFYDKQTRTELFKKRRKAANKERRKTNRTSKTKEFKNKHQKRKLVNQGIFNCDEANKIRIKNSIASLFVDVEHKIKENFADPEIVAAISTKLAAIVSALHLLQGEKRPSKIIATLTLAITGIVPELSQRAISGSFNFTRAQIRYFQERFGFNPFQQQAIFDDKNENIAWIKNLPEYIDNWEACKHSPAFSKISELISIVATMGFIDGKNLTVSVKGLELLRLGTVKKHADVTDLISAILSSLEYFISGGYEFFLTGSPRRFLFDDEHAKEFDDLYEMLLEATPHAKSLNLPIMKVQFKGETVLMDDIKYMEHLDKAIELCKKCKKLCKNTWQTSFFQTRLERMIGWRADYNARRSNGKFRKAPLSMWIYGTSGVGKTVLSQLLIKSMLCYMGVPTDELDRIASINEQDKYDSTITGGVHAYLTDDVMNTKAEYLETAPTQKIIDHNNNAPLFANKAEIEGKGVTPHNPKVTCYTSNCKIENVAKQYSNCTESVCRRMIINIDVRVKAQFCLPGETRMDSDLVRRTFGDNPMPDIWEVKISECSSQGQTGMIELGHDFRPNVNRGHLFNIYEVMQYCYNKADSHMANQDHLQNMQSNLVEKMALCPTCKRVGPMCVCNPLNVIPSSEPQGIISNSPSQTTLSIVEQINHIPRLVDVGQPDSSSQEDCPDDIAAYEIAFEQYCENGHILPGYTREDFEPPQPEPGIFDCIDQANFIPPPSEWFGESEEGEDLEGPLELQAVSVPLWSILPGMNRECVVHTFQASFQDLIAWMEFMPSMVLNLGDVLIARFFTHHQVRRLYWALWAPFFWDNVKRIFLFASLMNLVLTFAMYVCLPYWLFIVLFSLLQIFLACTIIVLIVKWYRDRMNLLDNIGCGVQRTYQEIRRINWKRVAKWLSVGIIAYKVLSMLCSALKTRKAINAVLESQSALDPKNAAEVKERDSKVSDWAKPVWEELHVTHEARTTTFEQLKNNIKKNLYHVTFVAKDGSSNKCDGLVIDGNNLLLPLHVFGSHTTLKVCCRLKEGDGNNTIWKGHLGLNMASVIEGTDLVLCSATFLNPHSSIVKYFPISNTHSTGAGAFLYRDAEGTMKDDTIAFKRSMNHSGGNGYTYALPYDTFNGLCMGILVGEFDVPCIAGVHLKGVPERPIGLSLCVTQDMIKKLSDGMPKPCLNAMSNGDFPTERYGIKLVDQSTPIHPNSPLHYLPKYSKITAVGNCPGRSSHTKSSVQKTIISDLVEEVCDVPCKWGAPKFNSKRQWQASLQYSANTSAGLDPELLEWAMNDYETDLVEALSQPIHDEWIKKEFKPLNNMEIMTGRDGARFLDAMPKNTSKGFPLSGPKEEWIERLDPDLYEDFQCPVAIRQEVLDLAEDMCDRFRRGERAYAIFKACVKDEPTSLSKDKVRVFQAADWAFQLLVRKYFLPLARLMSLFPIQTGCAVGINAHGPEWDEYAKYMKKFGDDRILAGDYSKFDLRMPAQMLMATYCVFINVCSICGTYSEDDLLIMRGIATEIAYAIVAYNGDLVIFNGHHPSGNNMTVYGNCGDNNLNFRCGFAHNGLKNGYTLKTLPRFRSVCALATYGDDAKGSVKKGFDWFNHITFAEYMAENDIIFTMPDKESTPTKYMKDSDADFLKRKNVFNSETGLIHGALDEDSIFKSLHTVLKSNIGPKKHAAGNIETALREWFHHGREVFTVRHKQMIEIAERAKLQHLCADVDEERGVIMNSLYDDYDARLAQFKAKHFD